MSRRQCTFCTDRARFAYLPIVPAEARYVLEGVEPVRFCSWHLTLFYLGGTTNWWRA